MRKEQFPISRVVMLILAVLGAAVMGYLLSLHFSPEEGAFCNLGEGLSCDIVNKSIYSTVFGIPMSLLGLLYFLGVLAVVIFKYNRDWLKLIAFASLVFLGPSLYLTGIEIFVLENICVFCELSKILIAGIIGVSFWGMHPDRLKVSTIGVAIVLGIVVAGFTYIIHSRTVPPGKFNELAQCLNEKGYIMYGSAGCSFCVRQKALFGDSVKYINEVECDPRYPNPEVERCVQKNITHTPTWIQEDDEGNEISRFPAGLIPLDELARISECPFPE